MVKEIFMMALAMLAETQNEEVKQGQNERENEIIYEINMVGTVIYSIIVILQVLISFVFYWRSRYVKEINWLPKFIMILTNIEGIFWSFNDIIELWADEEETKHNVFILINSISTITYPIIMGLLIRFQRAQVQLRAQEENTIKILKSIRRANIIQVILVFNLVISQILFVIGLVKF